MLMMAVGAGGRFPFSPFTVAPTEGGVVFFDGVGGNFYVLNDETGAKLSGDKIGGAVAGGGTSLKSPRGQLVAATTGLTEVLWPTEIATAKIAMFVLQNE